jgi:hypothetical protein
MAPVLPPSPGSALDAAGRLRAGAYRGELEDAGVGALAGAGPLGALRRLASLKRWHHALLASDELLVTIAVVDGGYAASGFVFAVERRSGEVLLDRAHLALPLAAFVNDRPGRGARATLHLARGRLLLERRSDRYQVLAELGSGARLDAELDAAAGPAPFTLVAAEGGAVRVTQKSGALPLTGELRVGRRRFALDGGYGGLDYTQGLLPRATRWRWAYGTGRGPGGGALAFNLAEGFGAPEDVLLAGDGPVPLPPCRFEHDREHPLRPWRMRSADGAVDLRFTPAAVHAERRELGLVRTRFLQVAGAFDGRLPAPGGPLRVERLPGVCEDQDVRW